MHRSATVTASRPTELRGRAAPARADRLALALLQAGAATDGLQARRIALQEFKERYEYVRGLEQPVR